jgi:pSer/pThr/pTyr-binding forkhead associated (FHA) protein
MPAPWLEISDALGERVLALEQLPCTIGRRATNTLRLGGPEVSGEHAEIVLQGGKYLLRDKRSRYGTFVNGEPVSACDLHPGDRIRLGRGGGADLLFQPTGVARLQIHLSSGETLYATLTGRRSTIGRSLASDVVIPDASVSRHHAVLVRENGGYVISDTSSLHGVVVNGTRIQSAVPLSNGSVVLLGKCRAILVVDGEVMSGGRVPLAPGADEAPTGARFGSVLGGLTGTSGVSRPAALPAEIYRQIEAARSIQKTLLPQTSPPVAGYQIFGDSQPCYAVGGDFYDFLELENGRIGLVLGDVSGKGLGAALLAHFTQAIFRTALRYEPQLDRVLPKVNEDICDRSHLNQFVTLCVCVLDPASGDLQYVNAGHCPPLIVRQGGETQFLNASSPVLGVSRAFAYDVHDCHLDPGSALVLYSDGFTECANDDAHEFGTAGLAGFFSSRATVPPERILRELEAHLEHLGMASHQTDDMTLLLVQRRAGSS